MSESVVISEVVIDPTWRVDAVNILPGMAVLTITHPRHGSLSYMLSPPQVAGLARSLLQILQP